MTIEFDHRDDFERLTQPTSKGRGKMNDTQSKLVAGLKAVASLMSESEGVIGLHLNGNIATWDELLGNEWLADFNEAMGEVMDMITEQLEKEQDQGEWVKQC